MRFEGDIYKSLIKRYDITESNNKKTISTKKKVLNEDINNIDRDETLCYDFGEYPGGNPYICIMYKDEEYDDWDLYADVSINTDYQVNDNEIVVNNDLSEFQKREVFDDLVKFEVDTIDKGHSVFHIWQLRDDWKEFILNMQKECGYQRYDESLDEGAPSVDDLPFEEILNKKPTKGNMDWYEEDHPKWKRIKPEKDKPIKESINLNDYDDGYVTLVNGEPNFVYKSIKDARNGMFYDKAGDYDIGEFNNTYELKKWENGELKDLNEDWDDEYEDEKYSLVGQDGNAFALMGYTARCMKECGLKDEISKMREEAMSSDYNHLIYICDGYVQRCNEIAKNLNESNMLLVDKKEGEKKMSEPKKRGWDPDEHIKKVAKYYRDWAGFGEDEVLTEDMLKNEEWRLARVSALKNTPVKKIKAELLKQKDSE